MQAWPQRRLSHPTRDDDGSISASIPLPGFKIDNPLLKSEWKSNPGGLSSAFDVLQAAFGGFLLALSMLTDVDTFNPRVDPCITGLAYLSAHLRVQYQAELTFGFPSSTFVAAPCRYIYRYHLCTRGGGVLVPVEDYAGIYKSKD